MNDRVLIDYALYISQNNPISGYDEETVSDILHFQMAQF